MRSSSIVIATVLANVCTSTSSTSTSLSAPRALVLTKVLIPVLKLGETAISVLVQSLADVSYRNQMSLVDSLVLLVGTGAVLSLAGVVDIVLAFCSLAVATSLHAVLAVEV